MEIKKDWYVKLGLSQLLFVTLACPAYSVIYFQSYSNFLAPPPRPPPPRQLQGFVRQSPYSPSYYVNFNAQRYIAVPGRVIQNVVPISYTNVPFVRNSVSLAPPFLQTYYRLESDPGISNPDSNNNGDENQEDKLGVEPGGMEPPPSESEPEQPIDGGMEPPPPESESEEPIDGEMEPSPPESEPEQPMMPPPPSENDNDDSDDDDNDNQDNSSPPPPPPQHPYGKTIHKHISIHVPPPELEADDNQVTVIRPKIPGPEKHVNIIFIKAPERKPQKQTEVILPPTPEQKTLVYILVKRNNPANDGSIRIRGPSTTKKPDTKVYFISYKQKKEENGFAEKKHRHR